MLFSFLALFLSLALHDLHHVELNSLNYTKFLNLGNVKTYFNTVKLPGSPLSSYLHNCSSFIRVCYIKAMVWLGADTLFHDPLGDTWLTFCEFRFIKHNKVLPSIHTKKIFKVMCWSGLNAFPLLTCSMYSVGMRAWQNWNFVCWIPIPNTSWGCGELVDLLLNATAIDSHCFWPIASLCGNSLFNYTFSVREQIKLALIVIPLQTQTPQDHLFSLIHCLLWLCMSCHQHWILIPFEI